MTVLRSVSPPSPVGVTDTSTVARRVVVLVTLIDGAVTTLSSAGAVTVNAAAGTGPSAYRCATTDGCSTGTLR